jgi:GMP synthase (glutamine-hydrolysing)
MAHLLVLQHDPENTLGHFDHLLTLWGYTVQWVYAPTAEWSQLKADGLVILGGSMNVDETEQHPWLLSERALIRESIEAGKPVFGICLGAQLIARSLGASVRKNPVKEIGWTPITGIPAGDPVLSKLGDGTPQFQWHEDTFDLPDGAQWLGGTPDCHNQAFTLGPRVYGVQFHPEVSLATIEQWLASSTSLPPERKAVIWADTQRFYASSRQRATASFEAFWQLQAV